MWTLFTRKPKCCNLLYSIRCSVAVLVMGSNIRFMSSVSYCFSSRFMTAFSYTKWPGTTRSVMCCTDTTVFVEGVRIFLITITLSISALGYNSRPLFLVTGVLSQGPKQPEWTSWPSECYFCTVLSRTRLWNSVWILMLFTNLLVPAGELWNYVLLYNVIQKDGPNFVRLYFLKYTWYVNDLLDIWKRRS